jgi:hypothetical protein
MTYRVFRLHASETSEMGALWEDLGSVALDLGDDTAGALGEAFGPGEYVVLDDSLTIADFEVH